MEMYTESRTVVVAVAVAVVVVAVGCAGVEWRVYSHAPL